MWAAQRAACSGDGTEQSSFPVGKVGPAQAWVEEDGNITIDDLRGEERHDDGEGGVQLTCPGVSLLNYNIIVLCFP